MTVSTAYTRMYSTVRVLPPLPSFPPSLPFPSFLPFPPSLPLLLLAHAHAVRENEPAYILPSPLLPSSSLPSPPSLSHS